MSTVSRVTVNTVLKIGTIEAAIGLYKTIGDTKPRKWDAPPVELPEPSGEAAETPPPISGSPLAGSSQPSSAPPPAPAEVEAPPKPRKGILKDDGGFVDLTDQIEEIAERSKLERLEIISFIDRRHIPRERIIGSYYIGFASPGGSTRLLKVLHEAMRQSQVGAVVRFTKRKGQTVGVLVPFKDALLVLEMAFAEQWRDPNNKCLAHSKVEPPESEIDQACTLIEVMAGRRESLDGIQDHRAAMERELVTRAEAGELDEYELRPDDAVDEDTQKLGELLQAAIAG